MKVGVPRERKQGEHRVGITPDGVCQLLAESHTVYVEKNAGLLSGFSNEEYQSAGAEIIQTLDELWLRSDLIVKVKEPAPEELSLFRESQGVFCFHHPSASHPQTEALLAAKVSGLSYDLLMYDDGRLPLLEPMSVIAGKLAVQCGAYALQSPQGGRGVLLGGSPGVAAASVVIIGAGASGANAARVALGMGAEVSIFDIKPERLEPFSCAPYRARTLFPSAAAIKRELSHADLVIGAVLVPGALAPKLLSSDMINSMKPGSVLVDICIDQGGISETSKPTTLSKPTYLHSNVLHYCVPNMPALVPRTSTIALTNVTLPWILRIARRGIVAAVQELRPLRQALFTYQGLLTNEVVANALSLEAVSEQELESLLAAAA